MKANIDQREAERTYDVPAEDLTPPLGWSMYSLRKAWNQAKGVAAPWWAECSKDAYAAGLDQLAQALKNWSDSRSGKRAGRQFGFPKFKSRRSAARSVKFTGEPIRVEPDRKHVTLPRLGAIKTHESTRKLERRIANGTARILSATIRSERGRWFVAFTVETVRGDVIPRRPDAVIGVDLGIRTLAVFSEGKPVENPRRYEAAQRKMARLSRTVSRRQGSDRRTEQEASKRWLRANAARNQTYHRVANQRTDALHKLTTSLAREYGTIVIEDLNVAGMARRRKLARQVHDASFGAVRRQLTYKTEWNGGRLIVADRWFPSSKTCSGCGAVKPKLSLSERTYTCEDCGLVLDRDLNAAINLAQLVTQHVAGSGPETLNGRGADRKTSVLAGGEIPRQRTEASTLQPASAGIRRGPSLSDGRIANLANGTNRNGLKLAPKRQRAPHSP